jgi:hypothetical protein
MVTVRTSSTPYVAHHLFTLRDPAADWAGDFETRFEHGLGVARGVVVVQTLRAVGVVPVFVEVHDGLPPDPPDRYTRVETASLLTTGPIVVEGEANGLAIECASIALRSGTYTVRVCHADLDTVTYDGDDGAEHYLVQIYPGPLSDPSSVRAVDLDEAADLDGEPRRGLRGDEVDVAVAKAIARGDDELAASSALVVLARLGALEDVAAVASSGTLPLQVVALNALRLVGARRELEGVSVRHPIAEHVRRAALDDEEAFAARHELARAEAVGEALGDAEVRADTFPGGGARAASARLAGWAKAVLLDQARPPFDDELEAAWRTEGVTPDALLGVVFARDPRAGVRASLVCARRALVGIDDEPTSALLARCEQWNDGGADEGLSEEGHACEVSAGDVDEPLRSARLLAATIASVVDLMPFVNGRPLSWIADHATAVVLASSRLLPKRSPALADALRAAFPGPPPFSYEAPKPIVRRGRA